MTGTIVVAGDAHLGAEHADAAAFHGFLDDQRRRQDALDALVLLGDVWDLVRRDPFGCAWETSETITHVKRLAEAVPVHFVFGNHDTHLRHLEASRYDVAFADELVLESGDASVRFCHGASFDRLQFDALSTRLSGPGDRGDVDPTNGAKDPVVAAGRAFVQRQKRRLRAAYGAVRPGATAAGPTYPRRERRAHAFLDEIAEDKLVYGHTHSPYVHPDNVVANPGSWKTTAPVHNTYLEIEDGTIAMYRYARDGPDETVDATAVGEFADLDRADAGRADAGRADAGRADAGRADAGRADSSSADDAHADDAHADDRSTAD